LGLGALGAKAEVERSVSIQNRTQGMPAPDQQRNFRSRRVGSRKPVRDKVGIRETG